jgi:hypothetical protein
MFVVLCNALLVIDCGFYFNKAFCGGAIFAEQNNMYPLLQNSVFIGNRATSCLSFTIIYF